MNIYLILRSLDTECNKYCIANKITFYESICHFIYTAEKIAGHVLQRCVGRAVGW